MTTTHTSVKYLVIKIWLLVYFLVSLMMSKTFAFELKSHRFTSVKPKWMNSTIEKATAEARFISERESINCTINFISTSGHFLTARHCIEGCLLKNKIVQQTTEKTLPVPFRALTPEWKRALDRGEITSRRAEMYETKYFSFQQINSLPMLINPKLSCPVEVSIAGDGIKQAALVYLPAGGWLEREVQTDFAFNYPDQYIAYLDKSYEAPSDFVVMKLDETPGACLRLSDRWPRKYESIHNRSFPILRGLSYTSGYALEVGAVPIKPLGYYIYEKYPPINENIFRIPKIFISALDASAGSSGSAVLSTDDEILGIQHGFLVNFFGQSTGTMPPTGIVATIAAKAIRDQIVADIGVDEFNTIFSCIAK